MELLREWLGPTVEQELGQVLQWRGETEANTAQVTGQIANLTFDDDGSNLRIGSAKKQVVQIIRLLPDQEPLQASLSDSVNRVEATISKVAVQKYNDTAKRRLTDGTVGGFLQLIDFEIVATHIGSRQKRITLFVKDFKSLGHNKSGQFGLPQAIQDRDKVKDLLRELIDFRGRESLRRQALSMQDSSGKVSLSQYDCISTQRDTPQDTQTGFATQAPPSRPPTFNNQKANVLHSDIAIDPADLLPSAPQLQANSLLKRKHSAVTDQEALLGLLRSKKPSIGTKVPPKGPSSPRITEQLALTPGKNTLTGQAGSMRPPPVGSSKIVGHDGQKHVPLAIPAIPQDNGIGSKFSGAAIPALQQGQGMVPNGKHSSSRISSRDVRISKDQENLLNNEDSWLPAEPGRRGPVANLPISILQSLNQKADFQLPRRGTHRKGKKRTSNSGESSGSHTKKFLDDESSSQRESESDAPVPDSDWPPSPARDQLPPDSSAESSDMQPKPIVPSRRSSNASLSSSRIIQSRKPSPLRVLPSSRDTLASSPLIRSPNLGSNSHREEDQSQSRYSTPMPSASRTSPPASIGSISAKSHIVEPSASHGSFGGDASVRDLQPRPVNMPPAIPRRHSRDLSESSSEPGLNHNRHLQRSPDATIEKSSPENVASQDQPLIISTISSPIIPIPLQLPHPRPVPTIPAGGHRDGTSSSLYSIPPSPESDLEMAAPFSLNDKIVPSSQFASQPFPSTASQPAEPFTQVKRTPYGNGQIHNYPQTRLERQSSPSKSEASHPLANVVLLEEVDHVTQSTPSILEVSGPEAVTSTTNESSVVEDFDRVLPVNGAVDDNNSRIMPLDSGVGNYETDNHDHEQENGIVFDLMEQPSVILPSDGQATAMATSDKNHESPEANNRKEAKRKASDSDSLSVNVVKRRRKFKIPTAFPAATKIENRPDPKDAARRYRQDFIVSRKSSEAGIINGGPQISIETPKARSPEPGDQAINSEAANLQPSGKEAERQDPVDHRIQAPSLGEDQTMPVDEEVGVFDAAIQSATCVIPEPAIDVATGQEVAPSSQVIDLEADITQLDSEHHHADDAEVDNAQVDDAQVDDAQAGAQNAEASHLEADITKMPESYNDAANGVDDKSSADQGQQNVASDAVQTRDNSQSTVRASDLFHANVSTDESGDVKVNNALSIPPNADALDFEADRPKVDTSNIETAKRSENKPNALPESESIDLSLGQSSSKSAGVHSIIRSQSVPPFNHANTAPILPYAPKFISLAASPDGIEPDTQNVSSSGVAAESVIPVSQTSRGCEPSAAASPGQSSSIGSAEGQVSRPGNPAFNSEATAAPHSPSQRSFERTVLPEDHASKTDVQAFEAPVRVPLEQENPDSVPAPLNLFNQFRLTYPAYLGDLKHFETVCKKIHHLSKANKMLHQYLWDDYVIRHKIEYAQHLRKCAEEAEDVLPYEEFYKTEISRPLYCNGLINRQSLHEFLAPTISDSSIARTRSLDETENRNDLSKDVQPIFQGPPSAPQKKISPRIQKPTNKPETIDLTLDDQDDIKISDERSTTPPMSSIPKSRRSLPWVENNGQTKSSRSQTTKQPEIESSKSVPRFDASNKLTDLEDSSRQSSLVGNQSNTRKNQQRQRASMIAYDARIRAIWGVGANDVLDSRFCDELSKRQLQLLADIASKINLQDARALLMAQMSDRHNRNPTGAAQRLTRADLEAVRVVANQKNMSKGVIHVSTPSLRVELTPSTYEEKIRFAWGVDADSVLETKYYNENTLTPRVMQLLAEISDLTIDIVEARSLIKEHILKTSWARHGDKTLNATDLEHVKRGLLSRDLQSKHEQSQGSEWWKDNNTPFKSFAGAYGSIKPGNGNSYAKHDLETSDAGTSRRGPGRMRQAQKQFDPLSWEL